MGTNLKKSDIKKGDKLRVVFNDLPEKEWDNSGDGIGYLSPSDHELKIGDKITVSSVGDYYVYDGNWSYPIQMFEKAEEESGKKKRKMRIVKDDGGEDEILYTLKTVKGLKYGDLLNLTTTEISDERWKCGTISKDKFLNWIIELGSIFKITRIDYDDNIVFVEDEFEYGFADWLPIEMFSKVENKSKPMPKKTTKKTDDKYVEISILDVKEEDYVVVINDDLPKEEYGEVYYDNTRRYHGLKKGDLVKVIYVDLKSGAIRVNTPNNSFSKITWLPIKMFGKCKKMTRRKKSGNESKFNENKELTPLTNDTSINVGEELVVINDDLPKEKWGTLKTTAYLSKKELTEKYGISKGSRVKSDSKSIRYGILLVISPNGRNVYLHISMLAKNTGMLPTVNSRTEEKRQYNNTSEKPKELKRFKPLEEQPKAEPFRVRKLN